MAGGRRLQTMEITAGKGQGKEAGFG